MNDVADRLADARHPVKRHRPVAAGRIAAGIATGIAAALMTVGMTRGALLFGPAVLACYALVLAINLAYSGGGRDVPVVDLVLNGTPHVVRFLMGCCWLAGCHPRAICWPCSCSRSRCLR